MPLIKGCSKASRKKNFHELKAANKKRVKKGLAPRSIKQRVAIVLSTERAAGCRPARKDGQASGRETHLPSRFMGRRKKAVWTACGEHSYPDTTVSSIKDTTCYYCKLAWSRAHAGVDDSRGGERFGKAEGSVGARSMQQMRRMRAMDVVGEFTTGAAGRHEEGAWPPSPDYDDNEDSDEVRRVHQAQEDLERSRFRESPPARLQRAYLYAQAIASVMRKMKIRVDGPPHPITLGARRARRGDWVTFPARLEGKTFDVLVTVDHFQFEPTSNITTQQFREIDHVKWTVFHALHDRPHDRKRI